MAFFAANLRNQFDIIVFFRGNGAAFAGILEALNQLLIGINIQFLLGIS